MGVRFLIALLVEFAVITNDLHIRDICFYSYVAVVSVVAVVVVVVVVVVVQHSWEV